ncbi:sensor histidine kinase [Streptomyces fumanus]|uniref:histidine kinase n=1 Tax=Streptomyces fumanus TaxID=67302 RepID=A0A919E2L1_9ACTN|nr:HAMP domain-containing sensor histidine kinase [Streptomyces fumanus]GHF13186.1 two-component sensor histidine kinase [Streptomyces fumanus]
MRAPWGGRSRRVPSLRAKLTLANVALLALGIVVATAVSLIGMRHYLIDQIDAELNRGRQTLGGKPLTLEEINSLGAMALVLDQFLGESDRPTPPDQIFTAIDRRGRVIAVAGLDVTEGQRALAAAVDDPRALAADPEPRDLTVRGHPYRATGIPLADGTYLLTATSTGALHTGVAKALKLDLAAGTVLLGLLAWLTMMSVRRRLRPLEDMVETSSAIAEGDLTRRVPSSKEATAEVEQLRLALNSMLHQVESAYRTRERSAAQLRRFVADASHELRTPLSAIRGYLQLYDKGMLNEPGERKRAWGRVLAESDRMGRLVDELLTLARLDQRPELRLRPVDIARLVRDAADDLRVQQPGRPVTVHADGSLLVRADESGLRQIVGNLLANVRVHTPADVPVRLAVERSGGVVRLQVEDKGPGLAAEDAARVFDRFFRAGGGAGSGLGLAIVQSAARSLGGEVTVRTAPGEGLAVTVTLPARTGPPDPVTPGATPAPPP